jgi:hypothetical protein
MRINAVLLSLYDFTFYQKINLKGLCAGDGIGF